MIVEQVTIIFDILKKGLKDHPFNLGWGLHNVAEVVATFFSTKASLFQP